MDEAVQLVQAILTQPTPDLARRWNELTKSDEGWGVLLNVIESPEAPQSARLLASVTLAHKCQDGTLSSMDSASLEQLYRRLVQCLNLPQLTSRDVASLTVALAAALAHAPQQLEASVEGQGVFNELPAHLAFTTLANVPEALQSAKYSGHFQHQRQLQPCVNAVLSLAARALGQGLSTQDGAAVCVMLTAWCSGDLASCATPDATAHLLPQLWPVLMSNTAGAVAAAADAFTALLENVRISEHEDCVQFLSARVCDTAEAAAQHIAALDDAAGDPSAPPSPQQQQQQQQRGRGDEGQEVEPGGYADGSPYTALLRFAAVWSASMALALPRLLMQGSTGEVMNAIAVLCSLIRHKRLPVAEVALLGFASLPELDDAAEATAAGLIREILGSICDRCCFMDDADVNGAWEDVVADFNRVRRAARDVIADIALSLHESVWPLAEDLMGSRLVEGAPPAQVEVAFFLIEAICSTVPGPEQSVSSQLGSTLAQVAGLCFTEFVSDTRVELAKLRLLNALAPHIVTNADLLQPTISFCIQRAQLLELSQEAGRVLVALLAKLRRDVARLDISDVVEALVAEAVRTDAEEIVEAATRLLVANIVNNNLYHEGLSSLTSGLLDRLSAMLTAEQMNVLELCTCMDLLGVHLRFCDSLPADQENHPAAVVLSQLSTQAPQLAAFVPRDEHPVPGEALCQLTARAIQSCPTPCLHHADAVFHIVNECYNTHVEASLNLVCALIEVSGPAPDTVKAQLRTLLSRTVTSIGSDFPEDPTIACAALNMCLRALIFQPSLALASPEEADRLFQVAVFALQADDSSTVSTAVQVFMFTLRQLSDMEQVRAWLGHGGMQLVEAVVEQVVCKHEPDLCRRLGAILGALVGIEPSVLEALPSIFSQSLQRNDMQAKEAQVQETLATLSAAASASSVVTTEDITQTLLAVASICQRK